MLLRARYLRLATHVRPSCRRRIICISPVGKGKDAADTDATPAIAASAGSNPEMASQRYHIGVKYIGTNLAGFTRSSDHSLYSVETLICRAMDSLLEGNRTTTSLPSQSSRPSRHPNSTLDGKDGVCVHEYDRDLSRDQWKNFQASSRTDAGVHAIRNCFHIDVLRSIGKPKFSANALANGLNSYLSKNLHKTTSHAHHAHTHGSAMAPVRNVVITDVSLVDDSFDARVSATSRVYMYRIQCPTEEAYQQFKGQGTARGTSTSGSGASCEKQSTHDDSIATVYQSKDHLISHPSLFEEHRVWYVPHSLNTEDMQMAADVLRNGSSETDYSSFRNSGCNSSSPMRKILRFQVDEHFHLTSQRNGIFHDTGWNSDRGNSTDGTAETDTETNRYLNTIKEITITIEATSFLLRMVRNMVGLLVAVGKCGKGGSNATLTDVSDILSKSHRNANHANSAPARGLYLKNVKYDGSYKRQVNAKGCASNKKNEKM